MAFDGSEDETGTRPSAVNVTALMSPYKRERFMPNKVQYEWDCEAYDPEDETGDCDHNHGDTLAEVFTDEPNSKIVLVRDEYNDDDGVVDRSWAYLIDGKLPEWTSMPDSRNEYTIKCHKVPKRFHDEVAKFFGAKVNA